MRTEFFDFVRNLLDLLFEDPSGRYVGFGKNLVLHDLPAVVCLLVDLFVFGDQGDTPFFASEIFLFFDKFEALVLVAHVVLDNLTSQPLIEILGGAFKLGSAAHLHLLKNVWASIDKYFEKLRLVQRDHWHKISGYECERIIDA